MFFPAILLCLALSPCPKTFALQKPSKSYSDFLKSLDNYEIIYPKVLPYNPSRPPRSPKSPRTPDPKVIFINLSNFTIKARKNENLVLPTGFEGIRVTSGRSQVNSEDDRRLRKCKAVEGRVEGLPRSSAILTICEREIFGFVIIKEVPHFVQPVDDNRHVIYETKMAEGLGLRVADIGRQVENEVDGETPSKYSDIPSRHLSHRSVEPPLRADSAKTTNGRYSRNFVAHGGHETYPTSNCTARHCRERRALTICDTREKIKLTRDMAGVDYLEFIDPESRGKTQRYPDRKNPFIHRRPTYRPYDDDHDDDDDDMETRLYKKPDHQRRQRGIEMTSRWAKISVGVDHDVIQFHGERTHQYIYTILNIVSTLFRNISKKVSLRIVVLKVILYADERDSAIYGSDSRYPLFSVNRWNRGIWQNAKEKHDMAMWMTQSELRDDVKTVPGAFMCQYQWHTILVEDAGWLSAVKIAHGIGHLVGLTHDGDLNFNNNCASESLLKTTIMSAEIPTVIPTPVWSSCSLHEFEANIFKYHCLEKPPIHFESSAFMSGVFSLDEQCRIEFGDGWLFCSRILVPDPCKELWCNRASGSRRSCMTRQTPTLEGTACGRGKRCINHTCEEAKRPPLEITTVTTVEDVEREKLPPIFDVVHTTPEYQRETPRVPDLPPMITPHPALVNGGGAYNPGDEVFPPLHGPGGHY